MLMYNASAAVQVETEWSPHQWTYTGNSAEASAKLVETVDYIVAKVKSKMKHKGPHKVTMAISDTDNFRKTVYTPYKSKRKPKPVCYLGVKRFVLENYECSYLPTLEGDDVLGIMAGLLSYCVIVSGDKDLKTIAGTHYNHQKAELYTVTPEEADKYFLMQCLAGDVTDGYPGVPGFGKVTALKFLDKHGCTWETVVKVYESKGLTEEDAIVQARCARILRSTDYDIENRQVILWTPKASSVCLGNQQKSTKEE